MRPVLKFCTILGALAIGAAWLTVLVEWNKLSPLDCPSYNDLPDNTQEGGEGKDVFGALSHLLSLQAFCVTSLALTAFFFAVFFLQLFYHDRLAHEVLLEDLADAAATTHFPSILTSLCSSFTHTLLLLVNTVITLTLVLLCLLGLNAIALTVEQSEGSCTEGRPVGWSLIVLDFLGACMFCVSTGLRCISRLWSDDDAQPITTSGRDSGGGVVGGILRSAADGVGGKGKRGKGGRKGNVKYSAVEGEEDEEDLDDDMFDADALQGGDADQSDIQRGGALSAVGEDDVEMMDMLDKHTKPAGKAASSDTAAAGKSVPSILPPPRVSEEGQEEKRKEERKSVGLPGDNEDEGDDEAEYDYGDVEDDQDDEEQKTL